MKKLLMILLLTLAACDGSPPHDVTYYEDHDAERQEKIAQCARDPGHLEYSPNCVNARQADINKVFSPGKRAVPSIAG